jgi:acetylglutamate kinase
MTQAADKFKMPAEAGGYIAEFKDKIVVVKYGGNAMGKSPENDPVIEDIAKLAKLGLKLVVVHGGGPMIDEETAKAGIKKKTIDGLRVTDEATIKVVARVLKKVNSQCVKGLENNGAAAENCTESALVTEINDPRLGFVGEINRVNTDLIRQKLEEGITPVISSLGKTTDGQLTNINADSVATKVAIALQAEKLTILTNVDGVLSYKHNLVSHLGVHEVEYYVSAGLVHGGMIPKLRACADAVYGGVHKAHLINGTKPHALLIELFSDQGIGTEIV